MSYIEKSFIPPAPTLPPLTPRNISQNKTIKSEDCPSENEEINFALKVILSKSENLFKIYLMSNIKLQPQFQVGPKCGLVALSIATTICTSPTNTDDIFKEALSLGYTKKGEIFNVEFLADLAEKCCGFTTTIIKGGLKLHVNCIIQNLLNQNLLLVPYDSDHNHSPCCKKGLKAHWAVISGFLILIEDDRDEDDDIIVVESSSNFSLCDCLEKNGKIDQNNIKFYSHNGKILISRKILDNFENLNNLRQGRIYLIGRQGKSKHIGLWPFVETAESNDNLLYFSTVRNSDEYVLPEGGPAEGLKGKAIILNASEKKK